MDKFNKFFLTILLFACPAAAFAADDPGFFASLGYGTTTSGYGMGYRIDGGYRFGRYLSVDAGYYAYSKSASGGSTLLGLSSSSNQADITQIALVGKAPLDDEHIIVARAGVASVSVSESSSVTPCLLGACTAPVTSSGSAAKTGPMFGLGFEWGARPLTIHFLYEAYGSVNMTMNHSNQGPTTQNVVIETFSVGASYYF